jgi:hypothetical protein
MPWTTLTECQKNNCINCPGRIQIGENEEVVCICPHHHLPQAQASPEKKTAKIICFSCRTEVRQEELSIHAHLDIGEIEKDESGTSPSLGDLRLCEMRGPDDNPPGARGQAPP